MATINVAAILVNYNMPERTDAICEYILNCVRWPVELFVVDNGSDLVEPSKYTTIKIAKNVQTTGGWLEGLKEAHKHDNLAYWFLITSMEFAGMDDVLSPMAQALIDDQDAVGIHPALTTDSTTAWKHLVTRGNGLRQTWMIDNIASLWRADWFDKNGGFDPELKYGWGLDLELSWKARNQGKRLYVHDGCPVKKITNIGYAMGRMNMSADERVFLAGRNMDGILAAKYGWNWNWRMREEYVSDAMR